MKLTREVDLGEYIVVIEYDDNGSGYIKVTVNDELGDEIEHIQIENDDDPEGIDEINPNLN
jgi:hypothetical protein